LKIALLDEEVIAADFMISQILSIFSPIGISPVTSLCLILLIFSLRIIKTATSNSRSKYKIWRDNGKPSEVENLHLQEKKKAKRHLRKTIRIEQAKQRNKERELIMETFAEVVLKCFDHIFLPFVVITISRELCNCICTFLSVVSY
jgi:hypothetical protein